MSNIRYKARARLRVIGISQRQRKISPRQLGLSLRQAGRSPRQLRAAAAAAAVLAALDAPAAPAQAANTPGPAQTTQTPAAPAQRPENNRTTTGQKPDKNRTRYDRAYLTSWADRLIYLAWAARNKPPSAPAAPAEDKPLNFPPPPWRPLKNVWKQNRIDSIEQVKKANAEIIAATFRRLSTQQPQHNNNHKQQRINHA